MYFFLFCFFLFLPAAEKKPPTKSDGHVSSLSQLGGGMERVTDVRCTCSPCRFQQPVLFLRPLPQKSRVESLVGWGANRSPECGKLFLLGFRYLGLECVFQCSFGVSIGILFHHSVKLCKRELCG
ncbi:hypothetical protein CEXT_567061 [Caerostris extrusa]|uniref:Secreted protein n=1 Tax=Caerostris extrusa TaxID=172846 RepID=A0AAV4NB06_CAEEX|nr:hypothetical protein CEXT_567061 [Caerostris extrusa]